MMPMQRSRRPMGRQMGGPDGGQMGQQPQMGGNNPIDQNRSMFNPTDAAYMKTASGGQEPTIEELVTNVLRVPGGTQAPVSLLVEALRKQSENSRMGGKMKNIAQGGGQPQMGMQAGRRPPGLGAQANAAAPTGGGAPGDLGSLLSSLKQGQ